MSRLPLFNIPFLAAQWDNEYQAFRGSADEQALVDRLKTWSNRHVLSESSSGSSFIQNFFCDTWGYAQQHQSTDGSYDCYPQFPVALAGQSGGKGAADLALGRFGSDEGISGIPQILCEFKHIQTDLDKQQQRKGNTRSPVRQCFDYLREARTSLTGNEWVEPSWGIVTDMNEFRLYHFGHGMSEYQRFIIQPVTPADDEDCLLGDSESACFRRFLFWKMFHRATLLSDKGPSYLEKLLKDQLIHEGELEKEFYLEYRDYRQHLYQTIVQENPDFEGTRGELVRLTQRLLDRCLFLLFCEDMGNSLNFPQDLLRDILIEYSRDSYYDANDTTLWERLKALFSTMRTGGVFAERYKINEFDGGLFEEFPELEGLRIPSHVFCAKNQGAGGMESLLAHPRTLLYFSAKYNFGIKNAAHHRVIDLYALGRIFEQSITELEIMEAEAEERPSLNKLSKRRRDGVYYTPEWVTSYIVEQTVGARLREIKDHLGLVEERRPEQKDIEQYRAFLQDGRRTAKVAGNWLEALKKYRGYLDHLKIVDPACGSGAFLVQALEHLKAEHQWLVNERARVSGQRELWDADEVVNAILTNNIYGVDINAESVEITKLAL